MSNTKTKNIGMGTDAPGQACDDKQCPYHGQLRLRGKTFVGTVVSSKMQKSVVVQWTGWRYIPKYERYKKTKTKVTAHNPKCIDAKEGDLVKIAECRPLSKTKHFVVIQILGQQATYEIQKAAVEEGKHKIKAKEEANKAKEAEAEKTGAGETEGPAETAKADSSEE